MATSIDEEPAKDAALKLVNEARAGAKLGELELHGVASSIADLHCQEMAEKGFVSHWGLNGFKPYQRYAANGLRHHVVELVWGQDGSFTVDAETAVKMVGEAFRAIHGDGAAAEAATMLDAKHTHLGVGVCLTPGAFRYVECYIDVYVELDESSCPMELLSSELTVAGAVLDASYGPYCALVYYDPLPVALAAEEIAAKFEGACADFSDEKVATVWPWEFVFRDDGTFSVPLVLPAAEGGGDAPRPGTYYLQLYVRGSPDEIPYEAKQDGVEVPGDAAIAATGVVLVAPDMGLAGDAAGLSIAMAGRGGATDEEPPDLTLEEQAARHDALAAAPKPDGAPIVALEVLQGVGTLVPDDAFEKQIYMPVERQEQLTTVNLGVAYKRLSLEQLKADPPPSVIADVAVIVGGAGATVPEGYTQLKVNLLPAAAAGDDEAEAAPAPAERPVDGALDEPGVYLCVKMVPVGSEPPLVDLSLVYGASRDVDQAQFQMGGGFETVELPSDVTGAYKAALYLATKKEGAGHTFAELLAAQAAAEAAAAIRAETGAGAAGMADEDEDDELGDDDELLDTTLTPEQVRELERRRAAEFRAKAARAEAEAAAKERAARSEKLRVRLDELRAAKSGLLGENAELQRKLAALLAMQKRADGADGRKGGAGAGGEKEAAPAHESEKAYSDALNAILDTKGKLRQMQIEYDRSAYDLQTRLDEKEYKAKEIAESFREFKREIARGAENSRTGKPIPRHVIEQFEELEIKREEEAEKVRLKNINLRMTLKKLENSLRAKEQLAEGLHLIDFEQLKIENQTLNEKIEERNEELHKLRKKNTSNVQVLTHIKEKLQFVAAENAVVRRRLAELDSELGRERDRLTKAKRDREVLRAENATMKQGQGFTNSDLLVVDFEQRKQQLQRMHETIADLRERYELLNSQVETAQARARESAASLGM